MSSDEILPSMAKAREYLVAHRIPELLVDLTSAACFRKPKALREFLVAELERRQKFGSACGQFSLEEPGTVFALCDLDSRGVLSREQCRSGLLQLAHSLQQQEDAESMVLPELVQREEFESLAKELLGLHNAGCV